MNEKLAGGFLYALGLILAVLRPPVDRLACMTLPGGEVLTRINPFFFVLEVGFVLVGSALIGSGYSFKNSHEKNGWMAVASGLGIGFIGGYSGLTEVLLFGALLATFGLILYKIGRWRDANDGSSR